MLFYDRDKKLFKALSAFRFEEAARELREDHDPRVRRTVQALCEIYGDSGLNEADEYHEALAEAGVEHALIFLAMPIRFGGQP